MRTMFRKVLILDHDPETLITLQRILEPCGGRYYGHLERSSSMPLAQPRVFDLIVLVIIRLKLIKRPFCAISGFRVQRFRLSSCRNRPRKYVEYFRGLGAIGVIPKKDLLVVAEQVTRALASMMLKTKSLRVPIPGLIQHSLLA